MPWRRRGPPRRDRATGLDEETARLVSRREGIKVVLAGAVASAGSGYRVDVRAIDAFDGKVLTTASRTASGKPQVLQAVALSQVSPPSADW